MKLLEIKNLSKSFDGKKVLEDISLSVDQGEVVSILGPSGSGKSTLLRCATFLETMDNGELSYCETPVVTSRNGKAVYPSKSQIQPFPPLQCNKKPLRRTCKRDEKG